MREKTGGLITRQNPVQARNLWRSRANSLSESGAFRRDATSALTSSGPLPRTHASGTGRTSQEVLMTSLRPLAPFALLALGTLFGACNPLYAPCNGQIDCAQDLRCVNLGDDSGSICTKPCSISKGRAGFPDAADNDAFYEDGSSQSETVGDSACAEGEVTVTSEDADGPNNVLVEGDVVGVCRTSSEQQTSGELGDDSSLRGWCAPL
jgi:hypothetical protein